MTTPPTDQDPPDDERYLELIAYAKDLLKVRTDPRPWIEANLFILTKDRRVVRLRLNRAQVRHYIRRTRRDLILKARQLGFTTLVSALFFADAVLQPNTRSVIVARDADSVERIFEIVKLFWEHLPENEKRRIGQPKYLNRREIFWPKLNSSFFVGTAGSPGFWRGKTINNLLCTEFAFWPKPEEALRALSQAVPADGMIVVESTPNGVGDYFHDLWVEAKEELNAFRCHFHPWWLDEQYRLAGAPLGQLTLEERDLKRPRKLDDDQIRWRRAKMQELRYRFAQEYPEDDLTCFLTSGQNVFDTGKLQQIAHRIASQRGPTNVYVLAQRLAPAVNVRPASLRVWRMPEEGHDYVIGADVAEGLERGAASCACVLDGGTGEQVAELHGRVPPHRFALLLDLVGRWYNRAYIAVERNNHGHTVLNELRNRIRYRPLYYYGRYDPTGRTRPILGWPTDQVTKPIMIDGLAAAVLQDEITINSRRLVDEMMTFVATDTGSQEAQSGKFDDRVIAAAIAWQIRKKRKLRASTIRPPGW